MNLPRDWLYNSGFASHIVIICIILSSLLWCEWHLPKYSEKGHAVQQHVTERCSSWRNNMWTLTFSLEITNTSRSTIFTREEVRWSEWLDWKPHFISVLMPFYMQFKLVGYLAVAKGTLNCKSNIVSMLPRTLNTTNCIFTMGCFIWFYHRSVSLSRNAKKGRWGNIFFLKAPAEMRKYFQRVQVTFTVSEGSEWHLEKISLDKHAAEKNGSHCLEEQSCPVWPSYISKWFFTQH